MFACKAAIKKLHDSCTMALPCSGRESVNLMPGRQYQILKGLRALSPMTRSYKRRPNQALRNDWSKHKLAFLQRDSVRNKIAGFPTTISCRFTISSLYSFRSCVLQVVSSKIKLKGIVVHGALCFSDAP